jgi:hypothetical protein
MKKMKKESWVKITSDDFRRRAMAFVDKRKQWEEEQLKQGKKKKMIKHPVLPRTFILKFE